MIQLLPREATVYEDLKAGLQPKDIAEKIGMHRVTISAHIKDLVNMGLVEKTGRINYFTTYRVIPCEYEIVLKKNKSNGFTEFEDDSFLLRSMDVKLSEDQWFYLRNHINKIDRTKLAKRLMISKMQLNFAIMKLG
jgi:DNA-binding transcriptional ArsR family regulator